MQVTMSVSSSIGLAEVLPLQSIVVGLTQVTKKEIIQGLVDRLVELGNISERDAEAVIQAILAREKLGSTAIGNGIAFPHCRSRITGKFMGVLGLEPRGVLFDAVDREPVYSVFLLLAPFDSREQHSKLLGRITAIGRNKGQRAQLRGCQSPEAALRFLAQLERP